MNRRHYLPAAIACPLLLLQTANVPGAPILMVDQHSVAGTAFGGASVPDFLLGQSFTPSLSGIDAIDLRASILSQPAPMRIALLDGIVGLDGLQAPVLGVTQTVTVTGTSLQTYHFEFPATIPLVPDRPYVMRFEPIGASSNPQIELSVDRVPPIDAYVRGQALQGNLPLVHLAFRDFVFAEGLHTIPEPSTSTFLMGAGTFLALFWRCWM